MTFETFDQTGFLKIFRFLEDFQICGRFSDLWKIFRVLGRFSEFWEDFQIFGRFSEFGEDFQSFGKIFRFLKDFQIFGRSSDLWKIFRFWNILGLLTFEALITILTIENLNS